MKTIIYNHLHQLGITGNYIGHKQASIAVQLALEDENRLQSITHEIYEVVAERCGCNVKSVERNIRTVIFRAWRTNREQLIQMAGFPLTAAPTVSQFIDILATHILRTQGAGVI